MTIVLILALLITVGSTIVLGFRGLPIRRASAVSATMLTLYYGLVLFTFGRDDLQRALTDVGMSARLIVTLVVSWMLGYAISWCTFNCIRFR